MTGDCCGLKGGLAESGITSQFDVINYYMGVTDGGAEQQFTYSGHGDYVFNIDGTKAYGIEGSSIKIRAEHRFGTSIGPSSGVFLAPTVNTDLPTLETDHLYLTNVVFTQFLSPRFAVFAGKMDTFDGDQNAFASGRGKTQFSNAAFVVNPANFRTFPYASLGLGFLMLGEDPQETFSVTVLNPTDTARTSGFDELFAEGVAIGAEYRFPTNLFNKPGHQLYGGTWNSREFVALNQDPRIILPQVPIATSNGSWTVYYNFDQYLHTDPCDPTKGWGVFGRAGIGDDSNNLVAWFLSAGIGGNSPLAGRQADTFGVGWYYSKTSDEIAPFISFLVGGIGDGQGVELFYNYQVTPWFHLTPDMQVLIPGRQQLDTALLVGLRGVITL